MEIVPVVAFGVVAAIFVLFIRQNRPEIAQLLSLAAGVVIVVFVFGYLGMIVDVITELALDAGLNTVFLKILFRVIGVAYLSEFGAQICRDAGEGSIAGKIEFAGKLIILVIAVPVIIAVLESILGFMP